MGQGRHRHLRREVPLRDAAGFGGGPPRDPRGGRVRGNRRRRGDRRLPRPGRGGPDRPRCARPSPGERETLHRRGRREEGRGDEGPSRGRGDVLASIVHGPPSDARVPAADRGDRCRPCPLFPHNEEPDDRRAVEAFRLHGPRHPDRGQRLRGVATDHHEPVWLWCHDGSRGPRGPSRT